MASSQSYKIWAGYAFENMCFKHINPIKNTLGISAVYAEISGLSVGKTETQAGFQIDLLIDRADNCINLCELKFYTAPFSLSKKQYEALVLKKQQFIDFSKTKKQVFITLISNYPLIPNAYSNEIVDISLDLDSLF